jgi:hypothetical protein
MAPYFEYVRWTACLGAGLAAWRYTLRWLPQTVVLLAAAFTRNDQRHKQYMKVLWIVRPYTAAGQWPRPAHWQRSRQARSRQVREGPGPGTQWRAAALDPECGTRGSCACQAGVPEQVHPCMVHSRQLDHD